MSNESILNEIKVAASSTIEDAIRLLDKSGKKIVLVVDKENRLLGVVTDSDVRKALLRGTAISEPVRLVMNAKPIVNYLGVNKTRLIAEIDKNDIPGVPLINKSGVVEDIVFGSFVRQNYIDGTTVFVLAGGLGTRLRPLTDKCPKPMLRIGDKPLLHRAIENFSIQGFKNIIISTHYLPEVIEQYFGDGSEFGVRISYVNEREPLGTAGSLGLLEHRVLSERIIVVNGDILTNIDFSEVVRFHVEQGSEITVCTKRYNLSVPFGVCELDDSLVTGIIEKPTFEYEINTGMYVVSTPTLAIMISGEHCDMPDLVMRCISAGGTVGRFLVDGYWLDIGSKSDFNQAQADIHQLDG